MRKLIILLVCSLALWSTSFAKVELRHYQAPMGEEQWRVTASRLRYGLSIRVLDYGIAYFEQYATKDPHFIMTHWQRERQGSKARVWTYPPVWRSNLRPGFVTNTKIQNSEFAVFLRRKSTLILLAGLAEGYTVLSIIEEEELAENAHTMGENLRHELISKLCSQPEIKSIRGKGLMIGIELDKPCRDIMPIGIEEGILFNVTAEKVIRLLPPLTINESDIEVICELLTKTIARYYE